MDADTHATWVPAAVASDILNGTVVPATLPSGPIAVWRSATGRLHANHDRCPHRGMRLSHGFVRGDSLSCIYHGWRFGPDGSCQHIPAHPSVVPPKSINCGRLPVSEQNGVAWVASEQPRDEPTRYAGYEALRSLVFRAPVEAISFAVASSCVEGSVRTQLGSLEAYLLFNARSQRDVTVVALVETGAQTAERLAASSALEALRLRAEEHHVAEAEA